MNELELLKRAQNNDQQAFKEIFKRYKSPVFYMIYQMVNDTYIAEDLTMETFEKAFRDINKFVPNYRLSSWISKIGKNRTIDYIRIKNKTPKFIELDYMIADHWNPEKQFIGQEQGVIIENIVNNLKGPCKRIMELWMEGKKYKEIAESLNLPIGTVAPDIRKTRKKIILEKEKIGIIRRKKTEADKNPENPEKPKKILTPEQIQKRNEYGKLYREKHKRK